MNESRRPHRRWNPMRRSWVVVSPQRTLRAWQGETTDAASPALLLYDPTCYLCPGNRRSGGLPNPDYEGVFAFDNDFPALLPSDSRVLGQSNGLLVSEPEHGYCRVACFHPNHSLRLAEMEVHEIVPVVEMWRHETETLGADPSISYVQIFENRGSMMGASNAHPHCQIWATGHIPDELILEGTAQSEYHAKHGRALLGDYLQQELDMRVRIVAENETFVAVVPYWAVWPFETLLIPREQVAGFPELTPSQVYGLADLLQQVTSRYDAIFDTMFPYTMGFHQRPSDGDAHSEWTFHPHLYPPLLRSGQVRKYMVGFEMLAMPQRDITPEVAASLIRDAVRLPKGVKE